MAKVHEADALAVAVAIVVVLASILGHKDTSVTLLSHAAGNVILYLIVCCCNFAGVLRYQELSTRFDYCRVLHFTK